MADGKKSGNHPFLIILGIIVLVLIIRSQGGISDFVGSSGSPSGSGDTPASQSVGRLPTQKEQLEDIEEKIEDLAEQLEKFTASFYQGRVDLKKGKAYKEDEDEEYIEIKAKNSLDAPVNIFGWQLLNATAGTKIVLDNDLSRKASFGGLSRAPIIIERGDTVFIFASDDPDNEPDKDYAWYLYADADDELWEDGEKIFLLDSSGKVVDSLEI